jgi:ribosomal subunit interface protein
MDVRIRASEFPMTTAINDYVQQRLATIEKLLGSDAQLARCEVELGRSGGAQRHGEYIWIAEIQVSYPGGERVVARNQEATVNAAIDNAKEEVMMQLRKNKRLHTRVLRRTGAAIKRWMRSSE